MLRDRQPRATPTAALGTDRLRVYTAPLGELGRGPAAGGAVIVAGDLADIERTLDRDAHAVALCALFAAALAAGLATLLTRRALRPLTPAFRRRARDRARRRRVPAAPAPPTSPTRSASSPPR